MLIDNNKIKIRPENPSEYGEVNEIIYEAFSERHGVETGKFMMEHFMKERQKETFVPELSLVAVLEDGTIIGEVALHETDIITENGKNTQLTLSQSAVLPKYRMQGIMRMLVEHALNKAKKWVVGLCFLEEILNFMQGMDLKHLVNMEFIMRTEKSGEMKGLWFAY